LARTLSVTLADEDAERLDRLAASFGGDRERLVANALQRFLDDEPERLAAVQEGLADLAVGQTVPGDAVDDWLKSWGTAHESDPPACA
jgi:predicted transcriptional regulator